MKSTTLLIFLFLIVAAQADEHSGNWPYHYNLARKALDEQNFKSAIQSFRAALAINPNVPKAYEGLAKAYVQSGNYPKGIEIYEQAFDSAIKSFHKMIAIDSTRHQAYEGLAIIYLTAEIMIWG